MKKDTLYIVMPSYNEEGIIKTTVEEWYSKLKLGSESSRLVVADSGSTDSTHKILLKLKKKYPKLVILSDTLKEHGPKLLALYKYAIANNADYVFQTDSDGQTNPDDFDELWSKRKEYDLLLGHRKHRGDGLLRTIIEKIVCILLFFFFFVKVKDANVPFRLMKTKILKNYINKFKEDYNIPNIVLTAYYANDSKKIFYKKITFKKRSTGKNSINLVKIFKIGLKALKDFRFYRKDMFKNKKSNLLEYILLFVSSFIFMLDSPSNPIIPGKLQIDSGVFKTVSMLMRKGYFPYRDTFDHKGPLLYIINYLGDLISVDYGIWIIELLTIFITLILIYKIAKLKCNNRESLFISLACLLTLNLYFVKGNYTEEYALPFITLSIYFYLDYFINKKVTNLRLFLIGLSFGGMLLLRPNMFLPWVFFSIIILVQLIMKKDYKFLFKCIGLFFLGTFVFVTPFILWIIKNNAFNDFFYQYITFNTIYTNLDDPFEDVLYLYTISDFFNSTTMYLCLFFLLLNKKKFNRVYILFLLLSVLANSMSGRPYLHYNMVIVPLFVYPFMEGFEFAKNKPIYKKIGILFVILFIMIPNTMTLYNNLKHNYITNGYEDKSVLYIEELIRKNSKEEECIAMFGNKNYYYVETNRLPCSKNSYLFPIVTIDNNIFATFYSDLEKNKPKIFIYDYSYYTPYLDIYLEANNYKLIYSNEMDYVYLREE